MDNARAIFFGKPPSRRVVTQTIMLRRTNGSMLDDSAERESSMNSASHIGDA
jgi:hypothetical protein